MPHPKDIYDVINNNEQKNIPFPHEIKNVDLDTNEQLLKDFTGKSKVQLSLRSAPWFCVRSCSVCNAIVLNDVYEIYQNSFWFYFSEYAAVNDCYTYPAEMHNRYGLR